MVDLVNNHDAQLFTGFALGPKLTLGCKVVFEFPRKSLTYESKAWYRNVPKILVANKSDLADDPDVKNDLEVKKIIQFKIVFECISIPTQS